MFCIQSSLKRNSTEGSLFREILFVHPTSIRTTRGRQWKPSDIPNHSVSFVVSCTSFVHIWTTNSQHNRATALDGWTSMLSNYLYSVAAIYCDHRQEVDKWVERWHLQVLLSQHLLLSCPENIASWSRIQNILILFVPTRNCSHLPVNATELQVNSDQPPTQSVTSAQFIEASSPPAMLSPREARSQSFVRSSIQHIAFLYMIDFKLS